MTPEETRFHELVEAGKKARRLGLKHCPFKPDGMSSEAWRTGWIEQDKIERRLTEEYTKRHDFITEDPDPCHR